MADVQPPPGFEWLKDPTFCTPCDFVGRIAAHAYPAEAKRASEKRVRARIDYALRTRKLRATEFGVVYEDFIRWALRTFPNLQSADWIHPHWKRQPVTVGLQVRWAKAKPPEPEKSPSQLRIEAYQARIDELEKQVADLKSKLEATTSKLHKLEEKDRRTRELKSVAGKNGGRGRSRW